MTRLNIPLFVALAVSILATVPANAGGDILPHQRMIRKRGPAIIERIQAYDHGLHIRQVDPTRSAASSPATSAASATSAAASATRSSASSAASTTSAAATSSATSETASVASSTSSGGLLDSLTSSLLSTSSATSTSSIPTTSSTSSVVTTTPSSSSSIAPLTTEAAATTSAQPSLNLATAPPPSASGGTITVSVVTSTAAAAEASKSAHAAKVQKITRNTIITLVVIASCIGGAIAIWTVIRKWKLSPSEKFDDRMNPIDWAPPPAVGAHDETMEEKRHRRAGSTGSHGSFGTTVGPSDNGHAKGMYNDSQHGHGYGVQPQDFPPAHDFTAGTAQPGYPQYYGGQQYAGGAPGYADLQRGPSMSESTYSHGASVNRGLSYNRGPAAGYEAQPGAGGVPPLPNPYGGEHGYDDYTHGQQPVQQQPQGQYRGY